MSRLIPDRYRPLTPDDEQRATYINRKMEEDLRLARLQIRSLEAEVHRLQQHIPKQLVKGERRPTLREKVAGQVNDQSVSHAYRRAANQSGNLRAARRMILERTDWPDHG